MKVLNITWKFTLGGIAKCFLTYSQASDFKNGINVVSACIDPVNCNYDRTPLIDLDIQIIKIKNRKDISWINKVYNLIKKEKPDLIFTHGFYGSIIIEVTKFFHPSIKEIPMIVSFHGLYNPPTKKTAFLAKTFNNLMAWICKYRANGVVIVSKFAGEFLLSKKINPQKLFVVYNGLKENIIDTSPIKLPDNITKLVFTGRIDKIKGLEYLLKAISEVKNHTNKKFYLYIIGEGPLTDELKILVKRLKIEELVEFVGYKDNISSWLNACDIFVLPSLQENHSIALLEAMRAGKAIVCTDVGGNPETVTNEKEALLVPSRDIKSLEKTLLRLLDSAELQKKLGGNARKRFLEDFTEEKTKNKLIKTFIEVYEHKG